MITDDEIDAALDRIARTPDGVLLYRFLQMTLMAALAEHAPKQSALRVEHGQRRFAAKLMAKMVKGIDESGGRTDINRIPSERTVVIRRAEPRAVAGRLSAREWLRTTDPELPAALASASGPGSDA